MSEGRAGVALKAFILLVFLGAMLTVVVVALALVLRDADVRILSTGKRPGGEREEDARTPSLPLTPKEREPADAAPIGSARSRIRQRGVLLVGMDTGEPPFTGTPPMYFPSESGEADGFDIALSRRIAEALGVGEVEVVHAKYSVLEDLLLDVTPKVDLVASGYVPTDSKGIAWSKPYLEFGLCLVVPSRSKVRTVADLFGKPIGIFDDDAAADEVERLVKGYTELVRMEDGYWDQLVAGRFAGFLYDYPYAAAEIRDWYAENPSRRGLLRIAQYNLTDSTYAVGVRAAEPDLLAVVDRVIEVWRTSPDYRDAVATYLKGGDAVKAPEGVGRVVVVGKGDTLSLIARRELGSVDRWPELWELNRDRFPNPHLIEVGAEVVVPARPSAAGEGE